MKRLLNIVGGFFGLVISGFLVWAFYPTISTTGVPLTFKIEGALDSKLNFRDAGASINQCAGSNYLPEGKLLRASGFFSGWSCKRVGSPAEIYSLNYSDAENRRYYCRTDDGFRIGQTFQKSELSDLEFLETWDNKKDMVEATCRFLSSSIQDIGSENPILIHCEAGRDRTGAVIALIAAWHLEADGPLTDDQIAAIECDYRKSKSLSSEKYGRIDVFLKELRSRGGVRRFLRERCYSYLLESSILFDAEENPLKSKELSK